MSMDVDRALDKAGYQAASSISGRLLELRDYLREWYATFDEGLTTDTDKQLKVLLAQLDLTLLALHEDQGRVITGIARTGGGE